MDSQQPHPSPGTGLVARLARWVVTHRKVAIGGWVALLVIVVGLSGAAKPKYSQNFSLPNTESQRAIDLLKRQFPAQAGDSDQIVLRARTGVVTDSSVRARVEPMLAQVARLPHVANVVSPYAPGRSAIALSHDGRTAFATVDFDKRANAVPKADIQRVIDTARAAGSPAVQVELGGQAIEQAQQQSFGVASVVGLVAAIVVLLLTFGSLIAMGLPIVTAVVGLGTAFGVIGLVTHVVDMPDVATELAAMIGLGVGIDYALFILTRFREGYRGGLNADDAVVVAMDTSGRAVLFAGLTVVVAVLGMCLLGVNFLTGLAVATAIGVFMTLLAALTILPALLSRFGERIGRPSRRAAKREAAGEAHSANFWERWAGIVARRPWPAMLAGLAVVLVLAFPVLSMRIGQSDAGNGSTSQTTRRAYDLLAEGFGKGFNGPLQVVAQLRGPHDRSALALSHVADTLRTTPGIAKVSAPVLSPSGTTATLQAFPTSAPQDAATTDLVHRLRDRVMPPLERATGATLLVTGSTAIGVDFSSVLAAKLPLFIGLIVGFAALLLLVVFRSLVIPLQAAAMNILSIGASLGAAVAIFQKGVLGGALGIQSGPIDAFIPVLLFSIIFGLSMDYEVFLVSRIHEEWVRRRDASQAVVGGLSATGRVITAAATIMICVFLSFALNPDRGVKLFGVSFAIAVFVDAFVVRSLLLPATLQLLGKRTWWLPGWLDRGMPHLSIEPPELAEQPAAASSNGADPERELERVS